MSQPGAKYFLLIVAISVCCSCKNQQIYLKSKSAKNLFQYNAKMENLQMEDSLLKVDCRLYDDKGRLLVLDSPDSIWHNLEYYENGGWKQARKPSIQLTTKNNCNSQDYTILMDLSGSMANRKAYINGQVEEFLNYKNEEDEVAIIKFSSYPILASRFQCSRDELKMELADSADVFVTINTNIFRAYKLFVDSLKNSAPHHQQSVIVFSDFSCLYSNLFNKTAKELYKEGIETHRFVYKTVLGTIMAKIFYRKYISNEALRAFGNTYFVKNKSHLNRRIKETINENCSFLTLQLPLYQSGENKYRITTKIKGKANKYFISWNCSPNLQANKKVDLVEDNIVSEVHKIEPVLLNVYFNKNASVILPKSALAIDGLFEMMLKNPGMNIEIHGYTDNEGSDDHNLQLSLKRANAVKTALVNKGVDGKRIGVKGFGATNPVASNKTRHGRAKNRRTEMIIVAW